MIKVQWSIFDPLGTLQPTIEATTLSVDGFRVAQVFRLKDNWKICYFDDSIHQVCHEVSQDAVKEMALNESLNKLKLLVAELEIMRDAQGINGSKHCERNQTLNS